ncbi:MAG: chorismate synthase [Candidatus Altiarchaeota archaeon]
MNTFGRIFRMTTWGESHGSAVGCVVDGCPSNLEIGLKDVQSALDRRRPGQSSVSTQREESDMVEILSGVFEGSTLGTPIMMVVKNTDVDSSKYVELVNTPRPGHADYTWRVKYGHVDWRGGGRASARETVGRVAAGAVAGKLLGKFGIDVVAYTRQVGGVVSEETLDVGMRGVRDLVESNPVRALDVEKSRLMEEVIIEARKMGDSVGGVVECVVLNPPAGLGEPVYGRLDADLASALMGIPGVKGVEVGAGFRMAGMHGSEANDEFIVKDGKVRTRTNNCGGIQGGISNGMPIVVRAVMKPTSSIAKKQNTVDLGSMTDTNVQVGGRHDPCIVPRAVPVVEAMVNMVVADHCRISGVIPGRL